MSKFKIINLVDKIFISCAVFLILYAWINFYLRDLWITFVLSLIFTAATLFVFYYFLNKKKNKTFTTNKQLEDINTQFLIFRLNPTKEKLLLLKKIISKNFDVTIKDKTIVYVNNNKKHKLVLATHLETIDNQNLISLIDEFNNEEIDVLQIVCNHVDANINSKIFINKEIQFVNKKMLYLDYFLKHNIFPNSSNINLKINKLKIADILKNLFIPQKAKSYFFCGLVLIFSSIILPYHYYYIIVGSMLMLFSIICKVLPKFKD